MTQGMAPKRVLAVPLIGLVAFTLAPSTYLHPFWSTAFCAILLAYRWWLEWVERPMPPRPILFVGQLVAVGAVFVNFNTLIGDESAGTLLSLLAGLKLFELRAKRDYFIGVLLCFLNLMVFLLLSQSLFMTLFMIADGLLIFAFMFVLEQGWDGPLGRIDAEMRRSLASSALLLIKALPLMILIFLLFPRFSTGFGSSSSVSGKMGVSDQLRPGSVSKLISSDELVFRATFLRGEMPPRQLLYWRGTVLNHSGGLNWDRVSSSSGKTAFPPLSGVDQNLEIYLEPGYERFLFALENTATLGFPSGLHVHLSPGHVFELDSPLQTRERYLIQNSSGFAPETQDPTDYLQVPGAPGKLLAKYLASARRPTTAATVSDLMARFQSGGFVYTLEPPPVQDLDEFFFKTKSGFCEHYAGTMATILRYLGIPARVVVGFQGGTPSFLENYITVRAHDAHAWVEYFDDETKRWYRADPTAQIDPLRIAKGSDSYREREEGWLATLGWSGMARLYAKSTALFDQVDAMWAGFLLHFDLARQREFLTRFGMEGVLYRALPVFLVLGIGLILAFLYFFEAQAREAIPPEESLYRQLLYRLKRKRLTIEKRTNEGPVDWLGRVEALHPDLGKRLRPILEELIFIRFGGKRMTRELHMELRRRIRRL